MHYYQIMYRKLHILHTLLGCKERFEINFLEVKVMLWKKNLLLKSIQNNSSDGVPLLWKSDLGQPVKQFKIQVGFYLKPFFHVSILLSQQLLSSEEDERNN